MTMEYECESFKRSSSADPFSLLIFFIFFLFFVFLWPHWLFLFISHFSSLGSFNLSSFGIFYFVLFGIFSSFKGTLYILQEYKEDLHTLQEVINTKKDEKLS